MSNKEAFAALHGKGIPPDDVIAAYPNTWIVWQAAIAHERERCAKVCEAHEDDQFALYKGRKPYTGKETDRANPYIDGRSDGAGWCADAIRRGEQ